MTQPPQVDNEPVLSYAPGTPERAELERELEAQRSQSLDIPLCIGGEDVWTAKSQSFSSPHCHELVLGCYALAGTAEVDEAVSAATAAKASWQRTDPAARAAIFLRAAELAARQWRQKLNASTMLNQSKTAYQAEIDAACELVDFFRFNVAYADALTREPLISPPGTWNRFDYRPLDGFVYAVTPFNFTSIAANLPTAPALMGNTVVWKPSPRAALSAHYVMQLLRAAGLPGGVINLIYGDAEQVSARVFEHREFGGLHFTGSTKVLQGLYRAIGNNIASYRCYPRIVGESGGKDFIVAHPSADLEALTTAIIRGGFEYQGQKCSAVSRVYVPSSLWPGLSRRLREEIAEIRIGDPTRDFSVFMGAVIGIEAFDKITSYLTAAAEDPRCHIIAGGGARDKDGYFIEPTLIQVDDPQHRLMAEEVFGPVVMLWVYEDDRFPEALRLCDATSPYGLTGAIFASDRAAIEHACEALRFAAGNFYINDKPTGAVVGQQPFGGSRWSGTNDKAGSPLNLLRWVSPRVIKENFAPPTSWRYPFMVKS